MEIGHFRPTLKMLHLVAEIDVFSSLWRAMPGISSNRLAALKRVATVESIGSSTRIEGVTLSDQEVEALLSGIRKKSFSSRDEQEVAGYAEVMETIFENWQVIPFTENHIKQLHRDLLKHSTKDSRHRGHYKTVSNNVEAFGPDGKRLGIVFKTATPFQTPYKMAELVSWTNDAMNTNEIHPLLVIAIFVVVFLAIHPFQDGNGRLSRALTTLLLLKTGYAYVPYASLESVIEANKEAYYLALRQTQITLGSADPDWTPWIQFFLQSMQIQKSHLESKIAQARILEGALPVLSTRILDLVRSHGRIQTSEIEALTHESRSTIKLRLKELTAQGFLSRNGRGPATWYTLR